MKRPIIAALVLAGFASAAPLAAQSLEDVPSEFKDTTSKKAWHATVERTERGYLIGNPNAEARLVMFTSYGCKGCYDFMFKGDPELDLALLAPGIMNLEIRLRFDHPADLPLALLAACGKPAKFKVNHAMLMRDQKRWMERWNSASAYSRDLWSRGYTSSRVSLVSALDFDDMMARRRGYSLMDLNLCLNSRGTMLSLLDGAKQDQEEFDLPNDAEGYARPHFVLDGELLEGVRDWDALYPILRDRFRPRPDEE